MNWLLSSSIGRKLIMSISGLFLVLFLLFHMSMNLVMVFSVEAYDEICELLGANWYAIIGTLILTGGVFVHILFSIMLTIQNRKARGKNRYASSNKTKTSWSSKNMLVLGFVVVAFMLLHMYQFWYEMQFKELLHIEGAISKGSELILPLFKMPGYVIIYLLAFVALWFHLTHGFWSALQTIGWNNKIWKSRLEIVSYVLSTIIFIGFSIVPIYVYFFTN